MDERTHARYMSDIAYFLSKMEAEPNSGYFIPIALAYNKLEKYDETIAMCKTAIERFPSNCAAKTFLAEAYVYKGQFDLAKELLFDVTGEDDNNYKAYKLLGIIYRHNDENTEALKFLTGAYIRAPEDEEVKKMIDELGGTLNPDEIYSEREKKNQQSYDAEEDEDLKTYQTIDQKIRNAELVMADLVSDSSIGKGKSKEPEEEIVSDNPDDYVPLITSISKEKAAEAPVAENIVISTDDSDINEITDEDIDRLHKAKVEMDIASGNRGEGQEDDASDSELDLVNALSSTDSEEVNSEEELASILNADDDEFDLVSDLNSNDEEKDSSGEDELSLISELTEEQEEESKAEEDLTTDEIEEENQEEVSEPVEDSVTEEVKEENQEEKKEDIEEQEEENKAEEDLITDEIEEESQEEITEPAEDSISEEIKEESISEEKKEDIEEQEEESKAEEDLLTDEIEEENQEEITELAEDSTSEEIKEDNAGKKLINSMPGMTIEDMIDDDFEYGRIVDRDHQDSSLLEDGTGVPFVQDNIMDEILDASGMTHEELAEESERLVLDSKKERSIERLEKMLEKIKEMKGNL